MHRLSVTATALICLLTFTYAANAAESPLAGKLWSPATQQFVAWPDFYATLPEGGWLLIGEQHDNPDHHRIQAELIAELGQRKQLGYVALEMATTDRQQTFDQVFETAEAPTPEALSWQAGWPWTLYEAPVNAAFKWSQGVLAADIDRDNMRRVYKSQAPRGELEPAHADFMRDLLYESHCGQLPQSRLDPMRQVQLARDQSMAQVMQSHTAPGKVGILLTGSIHARKDLGVPRWLDTTPNVTLLLQAVDERTPPKSYTPQSFGNFETVDLILFTPYQDAPDYCAELSADSENR